MDDFNFWWYIIAAVIYFLTRGKKKKSATPSSRPGTENNPPQTQRPKSFEELLREITEGTQEQYSEPVKQEPVVIEPSPEEEAVEQRRSEGERRAFADVESRRVYEESIKMAEGADLEFEPDEHFKSAKIFKSTTTEEEEYTLADEIRDELNSPEAKKAIIYSEILARKY